MLPTGVRAGRLRLRVLNDRSKENENESRLLR
jgi:hypothetical protein